MSSIELLAHRGLWRERKERNTPEALFAALSQGYGVETDIRDCRGRLLISHDMPQGQEQSLEELLAVYRETNCCAPLALNIKSDGLASALQELLHNYDVQNYFCFDMSVPDLLSYKKLEMPYFARRSEYEPAGVLSDSAPGVWFDGFHSCWYDFTDICYHLNRGQDVCVVSPELHGGSTQFAQEQWMNLSVQFDSNVLKSPTSQGRLMLCTDLPKMFAVSKCQ